MIFKNGYTDEKAIIRKKQLIEKITLLDPEKIFMEESDCPACFGEKETYDREICYFCDGNGIVFNINIPIYKLPEGE